MSVVPVYGAEHQDEWDPASRAIVGLLRPLSALPWQNVGPRWR